MQFYIFSKQVAVISVDTFRRMIPMDFAPWESVYYYFCKWKNEGIIEELLDKLRSKVRIMAGRKESPSLGIIDSRSVKTSHHVDSDRGLDENKKIIFGECTLSSCTGMKICCSRRIECHLRECT